MPDMEKPGSDTAVKAEGKSKHKQVLMFYQRLSLWPSSFQRLSGSAGRCPTLKSPGLPGESGCTGLWSGLQWRTQTAHLVLWSLSSSRACGGGGGGGAKGCLFSMKGIKTHAHTYSENIIWRHPHSQGSSLGSHFLVTKELPVSVRTQQTWNDGKLGRPLYKNKLKKIKPSGTKRSE